MQDNFNIHTWKLDKAVEALDENTFTDKYNDDPKLKGGQKDLPDALQAKIVAKEGEDHEVSMAQNSLKAIISSASELMSKLGDNERNIPGWIQDHITNAENYIEQANQGFHELEMSNDDIETDIVNEENLSRFPGGKEYPSFANPLEGFPTEYKELLKKLQRSNDASEMDMLKDKMNVIRKKLKLKPLTKEGVVNENLDLDKTQLLSKEVAKALILALKKEGEELAALKIKNLEPNSFEIYVVYKDEADDEFSFHVDGDKLKLSDFTFTEELATVDENGNVDRNEVKDNLLKTWAKHFPKKDEN